jgi:hypothetical protein
LSETKPSYHVNKIAGFRYAEGEEELLNRLAQVSQADFLKERKALNMIVAKEQKIHRFRFHRQAFLTNLETRWEMTLSLENL